MIYYIGLIALAIIAIKVLFVVFVVVAAFVNDKVENESVGLIIGALVALALGCLIYSFFFG